MGKMPTDSLGKSSELKLHCFCLFDAYSMPKDIYSAFHNDFLAQKNMLFRVMNLYLDTNKGGS